MIVAHVSSPLATWSCLVVLLSIHLAMNHAAVRAVSMNTLNRQRANIVLSTYLEHGWVMTPTEVSQQERIFEWDGVLRWQGSSVLAYAKIGGRLQGLLASLAPSHQMTGSTSDADFLLKKLIALYVLEDYLLWYSARDRVVYIVLSDRAGSSTQLKAWAHGLLTVHRLDGDVAIGATDEQLLSILRATLTDISRCWGACTTQLSTAGWDLEVASLETASGTRIRLDQR